MNRIEKTIESLRRNNFKVHYAKDCNEAYEIFFNKILPSINFKTFSIGDSMTMRETGVLEKLETCEEYTYIKSFGDGWSFEKKYEQRRKALMTDLFLTGTNAVTEDGELVNLDMYGNRINGINFGPLNVVLFIGTNKITPNLEAAMKRVRTTAAPMNVARHSGFNTPCAKTGVCMNCSSSQRICNEWSIIEKCYPAHRIQIILIDKELGL